MKKKDDNTPNIMSINFVEHRIIKKLFSYFEKCNWSL